MLKRWWTGWKFALSYFSVVPVRFGKHDDLGSVRVLGTIPVWLPLVGALIAGVSVAIYLSLVSTGWFAAFVAATIYPVLYGFIHTEAVADVADAMYAAHARKDPYAVIKDPAVGAMGALWAFQTLLFKSGLIGYVLMQGHATLFVFAAILARLNATLLIATMSFRSSFIETLQRGFGRKQAAAVLLVVTVSGISLLGYRFIVLSSLTMLAGIVAAVIIRRRIGFINGDVLGATIEISEIAALITGAILWH
jgi:adenosylcobinamide-GDP ribazoletransferase